MIRTKLLPAMLSLAALPFLYSCGNANTADNEAKTDTAIAPPVTVASTETIDIPADGVTMKTFVAYPAASAPSPIVLVVPEWWGLNDYAKRRAQQLSEHGYLAVAVDMFGDGYVAQTPDEAGKHAGAFYGNPQSAYARIAATLDKAKTLKGADTSRTAIMGYCFGGAMALNAVRMGLPVDGVVSFHGQLKGVPPNKEAMQHPQVLILHGAADQAVPQTEVAAFKKEMDSIGKAYTFKEYAGATHAFTNPDATETGKKFKLPIAYNAAADSASWEEMKGFFGKVLGK